MIVTEENIGDIICRRDTGERFQVADVTSVGISVLTEDGIEDHIASHSVSGEVVQDEGEINSFQQNRRFGRSLHAAEKSAQLRLNSKQPDSLAAEEASRVLHIVQAQRQAFLDRLRNECRARQFQNTQTFDTKLRSAKERSTTQQPKQGIQPNKFTR